MITKKKTSVAFSDTANRIIQEASRELGVSKSSFLEMAVREHAIKTRKQIA